ncbi:MAG TPA: ferredoxin, partial [Clostridiaceae bacterium]|nr:ferredoxin [Clostridiaceae bacterium]
TSEELAIKHKFISSPTIRVDGRDIQMEVRESRCESCGELCGDDIECRVWVYKGEEYAVPPKELIMEGLLNGIFGREDIAGEDKEYTLPENLKKFYNSMNEKNKSVVRNR